MRPSLYVSAIVSALALGACSGSGSNGIPANMMPSNSSGAVPQSVAFGGAMQPEADVDDFAADLISGHIIPMCPPAGVGEMTCHAYVRTDYADAAHPAGYGPAQLQAAYHIASMNSHLTVAIVDAYDDPKAMSDQSVYRAKFGLPPCTLANGCFTKVNGTGTAGDYPSPSPSWAGEISLDLDMVAANCPTCHVLLVEASAARGESLAQAVDTAASMGASVISNSYGGPESADDAHFISHYTHPGIVITASSGDSGYGTQAPAAFGTVVAVGGTTLRPASANARGFVESAWSGAGSGCSLYEAKPTWQNDPGCANRSVADVAYDANPNTGVAIYDSFMAKGWLIAGGTSVASPAIAALFAATGTSGSPSTIYAHKSSLFDIIAGKNGGCGTYLCTAGPGYDGPTGNGTPNGLGAFSSPVAAF